MRRDVGYVVGVGSPAFVQALEDAVVAVMIGSASATQPYSVRAHTSYLLRSWLQPISYLRVESRAYEAEAGGRP
jgi:hypothetical protein